MGEVTSCGICGSPDLLPLLDLGDQPVAEAYGSADRYPLKLLRCAHCTLVQLSYQVDQRLLFPPDHPYATGHSPALIRHYAELAAALLPKLASGDLVVDVGANDGTLLAAFGCQGLCRVAVEPTRQILKCEDGIVRFNRPFSAGVARAIRDGYGHARLITACNVLAHVPDPHDFMVGVALLLADDGRFVTENHELTSVTEGLQIDTVYHEHLRFYDQVSLLRLVTMHGLTVVDHERVATHGGSFRYTVMKSRPHHVSEDRLLQNRANDVAASLHRIVAQAHAGATVCGVSASTRATPLIHFAQISPFLAYVCEPESSEKIGRTIPGTGIPVVADDVLISLQPDYAVLFAWHIAGDIIPKLRARGYKGKFIVPLPEPRITDG